MTKLHELYEQGRQSPWIDNLRRGAIETGELHQLADDGVRGVTSNPTIFQKSVAEGSRYDAQLMDLLRDHSEEDAYWELAITDVCNALRILRPVYDASRGGDGFVSIEVAPSLAHDTDATVRDARSFHERIAQPNLLVKIPATAEGVIAIRRMFAEGRNINITLIFSLSRYAQVIEAYLGGLEDYLASGASGGDLSGVHSVASFFVSRVDTEIDKRLAAIGTEAALAYRGKAAVAQAKLAYKLFREQFSGARWEALAAKGATLQRPLWASTSTKNPAYADLLYVEPLMGPDTVNTMPESTIEALCDHGEIACRIDQGLTEAQATLAAIEALGVDLAEVAEVLEAQGVASFQASYEDVIRTLREKAAALRGAA